MNHERRAPIMLTHTKQYIRDLFGLGMAIGLAILGYMVLICLRSLVHIFECCRKPRGQRSQTS
jgi:hypothetical protein